MGAGERVRGVGLLRGLRLWGRGLLVESDFTTYCPILPRRSTFGFAIVDVDVDRSKYETRELLSFRPLPPLSDEDTV